MRLLAADSSTPSQAKGSTPIAPAYENDGKRGDNKHENRASDDQDHWVNNDVHGHYPYDDKNAPQAAPGRAEQDYSTCLPPFRAVAESGLIVDIALNAPLGDVQNPSDCARFQSFVVHPAG